MNPAKVDWNALEHAYGPAIDIPKLLAKAARGDAKAVRDIGNRIAHQGWLSPEAAAATVPFLWKLVATRTGKVRAAALLLLADLSCGGDHDRCAGGRIEGEAADFIDRATLDGACAGTSKAVACLKDADSLVRSASALLLAVTQAAGAGPALQARLAVEKAKPVRVDLLLALGWVCADLGEPPPAPLVEALRHRDAAQRAAAAVGLAMCRALDEPLIAAMVKAVAHGEIRGSVWLGGDISRHAIKVLLWRARVDGRNDALLAAVGAARAPGDLLAALIQEYFKKTIEARRTGSHSYDDKSPPPDASTLTQQQRELLTLACGFDQGWGGDMGFWVRALGLGASPVFVKRYLGIRLEPTLLDREITHQGERRSVRAWLMQLCTKESEAAPAFGRALAAQLNAGEHVLCGELIGRPQVPWGWRKHEIALHLLVAAGASPAMAARLSECSRLGPPQFWCEETPGRSVNSYLPLLLFAALNHLSPKRIPGETSLDRTATKAVEENLDAFGTEARAILASALRRLRPSPRQGDRFVVTPSA